MDGGAGAGGGGGPVEAGANDAAAQDAGTNCPTGIILDSPTTITQHRRAWRNPPSRCVSRGPGVTAAKKDSGRLKRS